MSDILGIYASFFSLSKLREDFCHHTNALNNKFSPLTKILFPIFVKGCFQNYSLAFLHSLSQKRCVDGEKGDFKALTDMGDNVQVNIAGQIMNVSATGPYRGKVRWASRQIT